MSDLAPLFTSDVAEVLRCQAVEDLQAENQKLKQKLKEQAAGRIVVYRVTSPMEEEHLRREEMIAEGSLLNVKRVESFEDVTDSSDLQSAFPQADDIHWRDFLEGGPFYSVKLKNTEEWIGDGEIESYHYVVRLKLENISIVLGVFVESDLFFAPPTTQVNFSFHNEPNPHGVLKLKSFPGIELVPDFLIYRIQLNTNFQPEDEDGRNWLQRLETANDNADLNFFEDAPPGSVENVFECLTFRATDRPSHAML